MNLADKKQPNSTDRHVSMVRLEKIEIARQRVEAGDYDRPDVLKKIVSRILDQIEREN